MGADEYFFEHLSTVELIKDVTLLYTKLVDLGVEYRNDMVFLADLPDIDTTPP
jgi:hypothetical protein